MNLAAFLAKSARQHGTREALRWGTTTLTYQEFYERALSLGGELRARGLRRGDRVAIVTQNRPEILETMFGCFAAGLIAVPMNARLHPKEMAFIVEHAGASAIVHSNELRRGIEAELSGMGELRHRFCLSVDGSASSYDELMAGGHALESVDDVEPSDPCWLFYTSGTTGRPKGATLTHRNLTVQAMNYLSDVYNIQSTDVLLHVAPLTHGSGLVALPGVARGALNAISPHASFSPSAMFAQIEELGVTHVAFMAPTQIVKCLGEFVPHQWDLQTLHAICYGGAPIYVSDLQRAVETFGPVFAQIYGQGECPITATSLSREDHRHFVTTNDPRLGSAGVTRTDVEVRVVDEDDHECAIGAAGEVIVRGDVVMKGYWNDPDSTSAALRNGWLHTGDVGTFDDEGYLYLLDRKKDVVITGGNNVYPTEVESVLITHAAVDQVVVVGIPDSYWGEAVHAVVVVRDGYELSAEELMTYCGEYLAGYKRPKSVDFVSELPVSAYGKVLRREVRDRYWSGLDRQVAGGSVSRPA